MALEGREQYVDETFPSFLELVRAGKAQVVIKVPAQKDGHETVQTCSHIGCNFVCTSKAEYDRHMRYLHIPALVATCSTQQLPPYDPSAVEFHLAGAQPHLPPVKKRKVHGSGTADAGAGAEMECGSGGEDVMERFDEDDAPIAEGELPDSEKNWWITRSRSKAKCFGCGQQIDAYDIRVVPPNEARKLTGWWKNRHLRANCLRDVGCPPNTTDEFTMDLCVLPARRPPCGSADIQQMLNQCCNDFSHAAD